MKPASKPLFVLLILALAAFPTAAQAQEGRPVVKEIEVQYAGAPTVSKERIRANMRTRVGQPYSDQLIEDDIRNLYASGNISNVRIFGEPVAGGVKVVVVVQTKAPVTEVRLQGATQIKENRLRKELKVKPGEVLNEASLEQDRQKLLEYYRGRGYPDTDVTYDVKVDEKTGNAVVVYNIIEGGKLTIVGIDFEGNEAFKARVLRKQMKTRSRNLLSFLTRAGRLQKDKLQQDREALRDFYQNAGYIDVAIGEPRMENVGGSKVRLVIPIKEGQQYHIGTVAVTGAQVFPTDDVRSKIKSEPNAVYSAKTVRDDIKAIQDLYGAQGYVDLNVNADVVSAGPGVVNVNYSLDEGTQSYIERVNIAGNTRTKDKVIRRELLVAPGDVYNTVRVDASKTRLNNLNYFSKVETYPSETLVPGRKDLNVLVEEKRTGSLNFGIGFSSIDNLIGFAEIQQGNFDLLGWPTFTGGGQKFRMRVQYGTQRKDFVIGLTEPYFLDYKLSLGGEVFYREADFVSSVYSQRNYGFEIVSRTPINTFTSLRFGYRLENIKIFNLDSGVSQTIQDAAGSYWKSGLSATLSYDTRDSVFLTRKGERVDFTAYVAGGPLGGTVDTYGFDLDAAKYFLLPWDTIFLINAEIAVADNWAGGDQVPIFDRLYLGGANNLRGFSFRDVGPKDQNGEPIGGNTLARLTLEYTVPIIDRIRGAIFYDVGFVNSGAYSFGFNDVNSDVGVGVRLDLPIGPVRIDYGIPLQTDSFNDSSGRFNFNIGYQF